MHAADKCGEGCNGRAVGYVDAMKFHSCMTLFAAVDPGQPDFAEALRRYFGGLPDQPTLDRIERGSATKVRRG